MYSMDPKDENCEEHLIQIGDVYATSIPTHIRTVVGSCIAVCLHDPYTNVGGMNHFMLPDGKDAVDQCGRYGRQAMEMLIEQCVAAGAQRDNLNAKFFGGGHVLKGEGCGNGIPQMNINFAEEYIAAAGFPVLAKDVGGTEARHIVFASHSGLVLLKRLQHAGTYLTLVEI
jgi:chemotaxis receptor (MCP) glutamine deamidase CheD